MRRTWRLRLTSATGRLSKHSHRPELSNFARTAGPLSIRIRPVSPGRRVTFSTSRRLVRGSPSIYHPRASPSRGAGEEVFQFFVRRLSRNAFNLLDLGALVKGSISRFFPSAHRRLPFRRQPYKLSALSPGVNPGPRSGPRRGGKYKRLFPTRQPSRGSLATARRLPSLRGHVSAGGGKSGPPRSLAGVRSACRRGERRGSNPRPPEPQSGALTD